MEIKELLEKAARTILPKSSYENKAFMRGWFSNWNPATDDGDCARMEAALGIEIGWGEVYAMSNHNSLPDCEMEPFHIHNGNKQAARRMASLRVAAAIYDSMG